MRSNISCTPHSGHRKRRIPHFLTRNFHLGFEQLLASVCGGVIKGFTLNILALSFHCKNPLTAPLPILLPLHFQPLLQPHNSWFPALFLPHIPVPVLSASPTGQGKGRATVGQQPPRLTVKDRKSVCLPLWPHFWGNRYTTASGVSQQWARNPRIWTKAGTYPEGYPFRFILHLTVSVLRVWVNSSYHVISLYPLVFLLCRTLVFISKWMFQYIS